MADHEAVELARWQGAIDERTKVIERRMDSLNGDLRVISTDISKIERSVAVSSEFRASWTGLLTQLRDNTAAAKAMHEQRSRWLEGWRVRLLVIAGALSSVGVIVNIVLNATS